MSAEKYLRPDVIRQVGRLDLRAKFIVEGFLTGLHNSPFQGFSVEFSEHRKYNPGDDIKDLDWNVYAKTDRYYLKKFRAETNMTGYLVMDLSASMGYPFDLPEGTDRLTKFDYAICLSAALGYLMIHQQDPVGLVTIDDRIRTVLPPRSKRSQLATMIAVLAGLKPSGVTNLSEGLHQLVPLIRQKSLIMIFSDLLPEPDLDPEPMLKSLHHLRHRGHDIIIFHVLDETEVTFPFTGLTKFQNVESDDELDPTDARGIKASYLEALDDFTGRWKDELTRAGIDYVLMHTGLTFDKALLEYLMQRQRRF